MSKVLIAVGTVYGGASEVAEQASALLQAQGIEALVTETPDIPALNDSEALLVITSTTGSGDLPDNIAPFFAAISSEYPPLTGKPFGVIALGDSSYGESFCQAGRRFEALLDDLGAKSLQSRLEIDAIEFFQPTDASEAWLKAWRDALVAFLP
ncbi:hypothetical protein BFW38_09930 [Terasakiispira papahanaumokuakeensis]|uniref:Flavodoxin-like domain-containing protein n=1 Tax=Terasakiispira papahanaumokuakeensis TaxID=197479 RepID=A0A1E2VA62_9GAMM|nr:flavodoxin [Terasakiispira papahanaumokuakeensis]ODC03813.1 hypothetical protein BFW38_09930 [Terasakiispira papahanaumokuakeensis]